MSFKLAACFRLHQALYLSRIKHTKQAQNEPWWYRWQPFRTIAEQFYQAPQGNEVFTMSPPSERGRQLRYEDLMRNPNLTHLPLEERFRLAPGYPVTDPIAQKHGLEYRLRPLADVVQRYYQEPMNRVIDKAKQVQAPNASRYFSPLDYAAAETRVPYKLNLKLPPYVTPVTPQGATYSLSADEDIPASDAAKLPPRAISLSLNADYRPYVTTHELTHGMQQIEDPRKYPIKLPENRYYVQKDIYEMDMPLAEAKRLYNAIYAKPGTSIGFNPQEAEQILQWVQSGQAEKDLVERRKMVMDTLLPPGLSPQQASALRFVQEGKIPLIDRIYDIDPAVFQDALRRYAANPKDPKIDNSLRGLLGSLKTIYAGEDAIHPDNTPFEQRVLRDMKNFVPVVNLSTYILNMRALKDTLQQARKGSMQLPVFQNPQQKETIPPEKARQIFNERLQQLIQNRRQQNQQQVYG